MEEASSRALQVPKRVILLFKLDHSDQDIVHAFLRYSDRPESEYGMNKHAVHPDARRYFEHDPKTYRAHLVIDMDADDLKNPDLTTVPHEIYRVTCKQEPNSQMYVLILFSFSTITS